MADLSQWSTTPTLNDLAGYFQTGMRPSSVKSAGWGVMADLAQLLNALTAGAGTANAHTLANPRPFSALTKGLTVCYLPVAANTGALTFAPDGLAAKPVYLNGIALQGAETSPTYPALLKYDTALNAGGGGWHLLTPAPSLTLAATIRNFFVDPCCRIAQNPAAFNLTTAKQYGQVDLVQLWASGGAVNAGTLVQAAAQTVGAPAATGNSARILTATLTGAGAVSARRWLEAQDGAALAGPAGTNIATFQVVVQQNTGGPINYTIAINSANAANNFGATTNVGTSANISVPSGVPTLISFSVALTAACANGIEMVVAAACGAVVTKTFDFTDWQAHIGATLYSCAVPSFVDDFLKAMRYFERTYEYGTTSGTATSNGMNFVFLAVLAGVGGIMWRLLYRVQKVIAPAITAYSPNNGASGNIYDATAPGNKAVTFNTVDTCAFSIANNSGGNLADGDQLQAQWAADARL